MKLYTLSVFASFTLLLICPVIGQQNAAPQSVLTRVVDMPEAMFTVKLLNEDGTPFSGGTVNAGFNITTSYWSDGSKDRVETGVTDVNGVFVFRGKTIGEWGCGFDALGYYRFSNGSTVGTNKANGRWEPWNPTYTLIAKKIVKPIPMYAKRVETAIPDFNVALPYDLSVGDWVEPRGKGKIADIVFSAKLDQRSESDYDYALTVSFSNMGDGIQTFDAPLNFGSELKSPRYAPEEGYQPDYVQTRNRQPGQIERGNYAQDGNRNYLLRVRTVLDEDGKVKSAQYGKVYGDFLNFTYYLNPTPNDRNMEFDPKRNLLKGLRDSETVTNP
jgi:hypothetical protein